MGALEDGKAITVYMAEVFHAMEENGDDTSLIPRSLARKLRALYRGSVLPDVFIHLDGRLCSCVASLPIPQQRAMLADEPVQLLTTAGDTLNMPPSKLTAFQVRQVFGHGHIRDAAEQRAWLESEHTEKLSRAAPTSDSITIVNQGKRKGVMVGRVFVSLQELSRLVASLTA